MIPGDNSVLTRAFPSNNRFLDGRGFINSYLSPKGYSAFRGKFTLLIGSDLLLVPRVFRPQYNHIIGPLPYPDATEHLPVMVLLNFSSTSCDGAPGGREVRTEHGTLAAD
jgi:hypothetical protein